MDTETHLIAAKIICDRCQIPQEYAQWAMAPDMDLGWGIHRHTYHRFSMLRWIEDRFSNELCCLPTENTTAIATMVASHLYLDMFAGPVWCWNDVFPAMYTPCEIIKEFASKNYFLITDLSESEVDELHAITSTLLKAKLPRVFAAQEFVSFTMRELSAHTMGGIFQRWLAERWVRAYIGANKLPSPFKSEFTAEYYQALNEFFKHH